ncbi:uncharacterized protein F5147DRAFT_836563 [Suillus discolor]|uniref:Uncharacterized protein n=1 Tax=Suillus discolor TaxID=1912936 RepID=A0A9P7JV39_9AGAM|nr:uncharacterized protein F5147DRAFT_836563 [Suillus discolor]KAG2109603.1 hypothetical protein F5147DRAFT_836563 [Suillus discolor]
MARATRSATQQNEKDKQPDPGVSQRAKQSTKKRKRVSLPDDDQPAQKQHRTENGIKEESTDDKLSKGKMPELDHVADVPLDTPIAQKVLEILEMVDSQGLLDRVFPLPAINPSQPSTSKSQTGTCSLRTLLSDSSQHPLRVLHSAVQNLFPEVHHARSRPSSAAALQLRFCNLAISLLNQASFHSVPLPLDIESIIPVNPEPCVADAPPLNLSLPDKISHTGQGKKYALMQRLPSGTWWSSLGSDLLTDSKEFKDLQTANAELVAILPSPSSLAHSDATSKSTNTLTDTQAPMTLGAYVPKKPPGHRSKLLGPRHVSCGSFLDYGPYASFAPTFDQEGVEIGREALGEVLWRWEDRKKRWATEKAHAAEEAAQCSPMAGLEEDKEEQNNVIDPSLEESLNDDEEVLEGLLSKEQIASLKSVLKSLELENAIQELLDRNTKALRRLEELQRQRLTKDGGFHPVEEGSEEWDTAQSILESLTLLASLRPRQSGSADVPLIPSTATLHKLHRTLPVAPSQGWHGTLPTGRTTALRDNSTLYIKSTATAVPSLPSATPTPVPAIPATATPAAATAAVAQNYQYSYNYAAAGYRGSYQYKPGQTPSYYPASYGTQGQAQAATQYYANQQYATSGQQQYAYSSWYQYQPPTQAAAASTSTTTAPGTPQTGAVAAATAPTTPAATIPTSYAGFFSNTAQAGQRAVANTVTAKPLQAAPGTIWGTGTAGASGYVPPTLPPHMRTAAAGGTAQQGGYTYQPNYYGAYQPQPQVSTAASPAQ